MCRHQVLLLLVYSYSYKNTQDPAAATAVAVAQCDDCWLAFVILIKESESDSELGSTQYATIFDC